MPSIGELANDIARSLYEWRVPLAVVSVVGLVVGIVVAHRLGWFAAARRHPRRTVGMLVAGALVLGPVAWYLASPIFIRTELVEAAPVAVATDAAASAVEPPPATASEPPASQAPRPSPSLGPTPTPTPSPFVARTRAVGTFEGTDDFHFGRGIATLIEVEPGRFHLRLEDFSVRNGPDLFVYLSPEPDGYAEGAVELGRLKATDGSFGYDLPADIDPDAFASALIWCKQFSHLFAVATFER
jgi:hypothetical protein